jgi:vacuolar-type H+-ATPase subunit H
MFWKRAKEHDVVSDQLSPLDLIRQAEAAAARKVLRARQETEAALQDTTGQAAQIESQARLAGSKAGQTLYDKLIQEALLSAKLATVEAQAHAEIITQTGKQNMAEAVHKAVNVVLGHSWEEPYP